MKNATICQQCGTENKENTTFCEKCGVFLENDGVSLGFLMDLTQTQGK